MGLGTHFSRFGAEANRKARRFARRYMTRKGGVAMMFGLAFVPLSILTLTAIDFHRASTVKGALQDAVDSAALAAARSQSTDATEIRRIGQRILDINMRNFPDVTINTKSFVLRADGTVRADASASVSPMVANFFLGHDLQVNVDAEVVRANDKLEIALVLDNTGSMQGTKINTLRTAATNLVNNLVTAAASNPEPDALKIGLVPFSMTVRVGSTYSNATWLDRNGLAGYADDIFDTAGTKRFTMLTRMNQSWAGCVESRPYPYDVDNTAPSASNADTLYVPYFAPDEPDIDDNRGNNIFKSYGDVSNDYLPDGISKSSTSVYGKNWLKHQGNVAKYGTSGLSTSNGKGPNQGCTMQSIVRLSTNPATVKTAIANMVATGNTNIPMGLAWGWNLLAPQAPFSDGRSYTDEENTKIVILMTDGDNVNSEAANPNDSTYSGVGYIWQERLGIGVNSTASQRTAKMDQRLATLCTNMKARGIIIYTVRVEVKTGSSSLLQSCASENGYFYDVQNVADLNAAFESIAAQISRLRISK